MAIWERVSKSRLFIDVLTSRHPIYCKYLIKQKKKKREKKKKGGEKDQLIILHRQRNAIS